MDKLSSYNSFFREIIDTINSARYQAFKSLNKFHIAQNFEIGRIIVENQDKNQWGQSIVDTLSKDINKQIDGMKGYSPQNLWRMRQFYLEYKNEPKLLEMAMKIPWGQNMLIIQQLKDNKERKYYLHVTDQLGWSRAVLLNQIKAESKGILH
jgi:predicted nuclease of restriction endonuclease-like (RecB) superfamily